MAEKKVARKKADVEVNWNQYFASIVAVCPYSKMYWSKQKIDICDWTGERKELGEYVARVYKFTNASDYKLNKLMKQFNEEIGDEEWLYSHPTHGGHSTPVPVLIQQDYKILERARQHYYKDER